MEIKISMKTRDGASFAEAIYTGDKTIVQPGGKISEVFASHIRGGSFARKYRDDKEYVDENRHIIKACEFNSPSIAAQFVNGSSSNGYRVWKVNGMDLGKYLEKEGIKSKK